jgi:cytochrome c551/c552
MRRKDLIFIAIIVAVLGIFIFLSAVGRKAPAMTARAEHAGANKKTTNETCLGCHAPDSTVAPMPARHPKKGKPPDTKTSCFACHRPPEDHVASLRLWTPTGRIVPGAPSVLRAVATGSISTR